MIEFNKVHCGDCLELLKELSDNSIDSVITDPPYGLNFMGKKWDYEVPSIEIWKECLRVLKPGGYLLSFAGTRTQHRMAVNIEDAGFEIRDMIMWCYGSGFPKSLSIGKAVDKLQGNERKVIGKTTSGKILRSNGENERPYQQGKDRLIQEVTKGNSEWEGWGTALKPSVEPITVARKPLSEKTVAENVLKWGTGGINIDACRIGLGGMEVHKTAAKSGLGKNGIYGDSTVDSIEGKDLVRYTSKGRFPANLILDGSDEVVSLFPNTKSGAMKKAYKYTNNGYSLGKPTGVTKQIHDSNEGSAARFFYHAKASKSERNKGCEWMEDKHNPHRSYIGRDLSNPKVHLGGLQGGKSKNNHPTIKPIALMEYLVKLVSRKGTIVLDPFLGSGTTAIACINLNRNFIGIEKDKDYCEIARNRINEYSKQRTLI